MRVRKLKRKIDGVSGNLMMTITVAILIILMILLVLSVARAEPYAVPVFFAGSVNGSVTNDTLVLNLPGNTTHTFSLSNASQNFSQTASFTSNVTLFNLTVKQEENFSCDVVLRDAITNATGYWENVTRAQLVPSVEQYNGLLIQRQNDSAQCVVEKNMLSNEIINWRVRLNASETNFRYMVEAKDTVIGKERSEKRTSNIVVGVLAIMLFIGMLMLLSGQTPKQWWDNFVHQTGTSPRSTTLKIPVVKGGVK